MSQYVRDNPNQIYAIIDTETEGLSLIGKNRPWQCGYVLYQNGRIIKESERFIRWDDLNISEGAARVTRFDWNEYRGKAEDPMVVLKDLEEHLGNSEIVKIIHNSHNFDAFIIKNWREALGLVNDYSYLNDTIDSNALARAVKKGVKKIERQDWKMMMFRFANYVEKGLKTSLTSLGKEFKIEHDYDSLHRGLSDVHLNIKVFEKLKWQIEI